MNLDRYIDVSEILIYLKAIFDKTANEYPQMVNVVSTIDLTLNWLLNIYDLYDSNSNMCFYIWMLFDEFFRNRTGSVRLIAIKMALALLCRGNIEEKYRCKMKKK